MGTLKYCAALAAPLVLATTSCEGAGGAEAEDGLRGETMEVVAVWSGDEQRRFEQVLDVFERETGATVDYTGAGDELPTVLETRLQGNAVPNVAIIAQPGVIEQLAMAGALKPLAPQVVAELDAHTDDAWLEFGSVDGTPYGVFVKAAHKSLIWYNNTTFRETGAAPVQSWAEFRTLGTALSDMGIAPYSVGAADGWVLTDWFENVYLRTAGPDMYDMLSRREIPWTHPSVREALEVLAEVFAHEELLAGGSGRTLQTDFADSVVNVFGAQPTAAMVYGADFAGTVIHESTPSTVGVEARHFPFPTLGEGEGSVIVGGDAAVALRDDPATMELLRFLASPRAGMEWAPYGGFLSPNHDVPLAAYPDDSTREVAQQLIEAGDEVRFDLSDRMPAPFGSTRGTGMWQTLQDFVADPTDIEGTMRQLEADAARAYGE